MTLVCEFPLVGAGGEPISFARTVHSHGCARLPPAEIRESPLRYLRRLRIGNRIVEITMEERDGDLVARSDIKLNRREAGEARATVAKIFRLHDGSFAVLCQDR